MKSHPSLTRAELVQKPLSSIALLIASEFNRMATRSRFDDQSMSAKDRAYELLGVLESMRLPLAVAEELKPTYDQCVQKGLINRMKDPVVREQLGRDFCQSFMRLAELWKGKTLHHA